MPSKQEKGSVSNFEEVFERIKHATNTRTQVELANVLDIRQSSISDAKRRNSVPADWCMKLFERFGLNPDWLKKGTGPMYLRTEMGYAPVEATAALNTYEDVALYSDPDAKSEIVSVYSMQRWPDLEAGDQANSAAGPKVVGKLSVPLSYAVPGLKVFQLDSTSMEPLIRKGAYVGVDTTQKQAVSGELYAIRLPYEGLVMKRVFLGPAGELFLRAENPQHPELTLTTDKIGEALAGRVVWTLNRY